MKNIFFFLIFIGPIQLFGQGVGIGTLDPDTSAILELRSNNKGLLIPRMDSVQRLSIALPAEGLIVYDNNQQAICYYDGVVWKCLGVGGNGTIGPAGPVGPAGPQGPVGSQGATGLNGIHCWDANGNGLNDSSEDTNGDGLFNSGDCTQGVMGPQGAVGPAGPVGPIGATGIQGPAGSNGAAGPAGPQGAVGPTGPIGPQGSVGPTGATGAQGPAGSNGPAGPAGPQGAVGPTGATGVQGLAGSNGAQGAIGPQGTAGINGIHCWDNNGNGLNDPSEDTNNDGQFNAADCKTSLPLGQSAITLETSTETFFDDATLNSWKIVQGLSATVNVSANDILLICSTGSIANATNTVNNISDAVLGVFIDGVFASGTSDVVSINEQVGAFNIIHAGYTYNIFFTKLLPAGIHTIDVRGKKWAPAGTGWVDSKVLIGNLSVVKLKP